MTLAQHQSITNEHYTPPEILRATRLLFNKNVSLDPATSIAWNNHVLKADQIYTEETDGLAHDWNASTLFLNPPGNLVGRRSAQAVWFEKLEKHYLAGEVREAIFLSFNLEILRHCPSIMQYSWCVPASRLKFWSYDVEREEYREGQYSKRQQKWTNAPTHANLIAYLGFRRHSFQAAFQNIGHIELR